MDESESQKPAPDERRGEERQPIELVVEYTRLNSFFSDYTKNISKGGTFIKTAKPLDIGTEFMFKLRVPKMGDAVEIAGRVHWVVTPEDVLSGNDRGRGEPGMGIRFVFRDDAERAVLEERVERVMIESLGQGLYAKLMEHSRQRGGDADSASSISGQHQLPPLPPPPRESH